MKWRTLLAAVLVMMVVSCALLADGVRLPLVEMDSGGIRALGMGGASVAIIEDAAEFTWNPKVQRLLDAPPMGNMAAEMRDLGFMFSYAGATAVLGRLSVGLGWDTCAIGGLTVGPTASLDKTFTWREQAWVGSAAFSITDELAASLGVTRYLADSGLGDTGQGYGLDAGLAFGLGDHVLVGVNGSDLGGTEFGWKSGASDVILDRYVVETGARTVGTSQGQNLRHPWSDDERVLALRGGTQLGTTTGIMSGIDLRFPGLGTHGSDPEILVNAGALVGVGRNLSIGVDIRDLGVTGEAVPKTTIGLAHRRLPVVGAFFSDEPVWLLAGDLKFHGQTLDSLHMGVEWGKQGALALRVGGMLLEEITVPSLCVGARVVLHGVHIEACAVLGTRSQHMLFLSLEYGIEGEYPGIDSGAFSYRAN